MLVDPRCPLERISLSPEGIPASPPRPWVHLAQTLSSGSICQNVPFQVSQTESWDTLKAGTWSCLQNHWPGIWRSDREGQLRRAGSSPLSSLTVSHTSPPPCPAEEQRRDSRLQAWVQLNKIRRENQKFHQSPKSYTKTRRQRQNKSMNHLDKWWYELNNETEYMRTCMYFLRLKMQRRSHLIDWLTTSGVQWGWLKWIFINPLQYKFMDSFSTLKVKNQSVQIDFFSPVLAKIKLYFFPPSTFTFGPTPMRKIPQVEIYMDFRSHFSLILFRSSFKGYFFQFPHTMLLISPCCICHRSCYPCYLNPVPVNS